MAWPRRAAIVAEAPAGRPAGPVVPVDPRAATTAVAPVARAARPEVETAAADDPRPVTAVPRADARAPPTPVTTARAGAAPGWHRRVHACRSRAFPRASPA